MNRLLKAVGCMSMVYFASSTPQGCYVNNIKERKCPIPKAISESAMGRSYAYRVMDLKEDASVEQIEKCYRTLSLICHPDKQSGTEEQQVLLNKAKDFLTDRCVENSSTRNTPFTTDLVKEGIIEETGLDPDTDLGFIPEFIIRYHADHLKMTSIIKILINQNRVADLHVLFTMDEKKLGEIFRGGFKFPETKRLLKAGVLLDQLFSNEIIESLGICVDNRASPCLTLQEWLFYYVRDIEVFAAVGVTVDQILALDSQQARYWIVNNVDKVIGSLARGVAFEEIAVMDKDKSEFFSQASAEAVKRYERLCKYSHNPC